MKNSGTYLMFERVTIILELIKTGRFPTLNQIQQGIKNRLGSEYSTSTIYRDIEFLRTRTNCPVSYSKQERGYFIETKGGSL